MLGLEKVRAKMNTITAIQKENGQSITNQADILDEQVGREGGVHRKRSGREGRKKKE